MTRADAVNGHLRIVAEDAPAHIGIVRVDAPAVLDGQGAADAIAHGDVAGLPQRPIAAHVGRAGSRGQQAAEARFGAGQMPAGGHEQIAHAFIANGQAARAGQAGAVAQHLQTGDGRVGWDWRAAHRR